MSTRISLTQEEIAVLAFLTRRTSESCADETESQQMLHFAEKLERHLHPRR